MKLGAGLNTTTQKTTEGDEPDIDEPVNILVGHPDVPDDNIHPTISFGVKKKNGQWRGITFAFSHPDELEFEPDNSESAFRVHPESRNGIYYAPAPEIGIAIFLTTCEVTNISEDEAFDRIDSPVDYYPANVKEGDFSPYATELNRSALERYQDWQNSLTIRHRKLRLLDIGEPRRNNPLIDLHFENGEYQTVDEEITGSQERYIRKVVSSIPDDVYNPQRCYQNCTYIMEKLDYPDRVSYHEGVLLPKSAGRISTHAWVSVDGIPVEPTMPWHRPYHHEAVYFGQEVPHEEVREAIAYAEENDGRIKTPLSATDEIRETLDSDPGKPNV